MKKILNLCDLLLFLGVLLLGTSIPFPCNSYSSEIHEDLILSSDNCVELLNKSYDYHIVNVLKSLITNSRWTEFRRVYPNLRLEESLSDYLKINVSELTSEEKENFLSDIAFLVLNPSTPIENQSTTLVNYKPKNKSQEDLLLWANKLVEYEGGYGSGLVISGPAGIGKTHISIAIAKEFLRNGESRIYLSTNDNSVLSTRDVGKYSVFIFDDMNRKHDRRFGLFMTAVSHVHDFGGKILLTTNKTFPELMDIMLGAYSFHEDDKVRYNDRTKTMFRVIEVLGESHRDNSAWFSE